MAYPKSVSQTVSEMQKYKKSLTLGWDVTVNYTVDAINNLLKQTFKDRPDVHIKAFEFDVEAYNDQTEKYYIIHYEFGVGAPLIKFNPRGAKGPTCDLTSPIVDGIVKVEGGRNYPVQSGVYSLVLSNLKLATAKGYLDSNVIPDGNSFIFGDGTDQGCVVIDLPTSKDLTVDINIDSSKAPPIPSLNNNIPLMNRSIKNLLTSTYKNIRYEIARVNSDAPNNAYLLKPKSFRFDAFLPSETSPMDDVGVLTLFIQTRNTNHGTQDELATKWENLWRVSLKCSPIPLNETASIITSKDMMFEGVIQPAVKAKGFTAQRVENNFIRMKVGTHMHVHLDRDSHIKDGIYRSRGPIDMDIPEFQLDLTEHNSSGGSVISWKFQYGYSWGSYIDHHQDTTYKTGSVKVTNEIAELSKKAYLDDHSLVIDSSVSPSNWKITPTPDNQSFWEEFMGGSSELPDWAKVTVDLPSFQLELANVNFFLTTNLLFPDDKQVIDVNKESGLHIPSDFYLVGKVVDK